MRKLILAAVLAGLGMQGPVQAGSANTTFDVNITLTGACTLGAITALDFAYTAFGPLTNSTGGGFNITCTNGLGYTFGLTASPGPAAPPGLGSINVLDSAVNLNYTINAPAGGSGNGLAQPLTVSGTIAAGQAGNCTPACNNAAATNKTHYLIVTY